MAIHDELVLRFDVSGRRFGIRLPFVRRVATDGGVDVRDHRVRLEGLLNLAGQVVPVIDIRAALHLPPRSRNPQTG